MASVARRSGPSRSWKLPLGGLVPVPVMVTVSEINCPVCAGFGAAVIFVTVAVAAALTTCETVPELGLKSGSPLYCAVIMCVPAASCDVENVATPAVSGAVPSTVDPSEKPTLPLGVPPEGEVTIAVKATLAPISDGFKDELTVVVVILRAILRTNPVPPLAALLLVWNADGVADGAGTTGKSLAPVTPATYRLPC